MKKDVKSSKVVYCFFLLITGIALTLFSINVLYLNNEFNVNSDSFVEAVSSDGGTLYIASGSTVTLNSSSKISGIEGATNGGAIYVKGTLNIKGGTIENCSATNGGAIFIASGGIVNIEGGTISGCSATRGYAIFIDEGGFLNQTGGTIINCGEDEDLHIYDNNAPTINFYIDGTLNSTQKLATLDSASSLPISDENCCGWFLNGDLSKTVDYSAKLNQYGSNINLYTKTATDQSTLSFTSNGDGTCYVQGTESTTGAVVLPRKYDGDLVISTVYGSGLTTGSFYVCKANLTSITFPNGIEKIENYSFAACTNLTGTLVIPDSVTNIGEMAFFNCRNLTGTLTIPNSITTIGTGAFSNCAFTGDITIPASVSSIANGVFLGLSPQSVSVDSNNDYYYSSKNCIIETETKTLVQGFNISDLSVLSEVNIIGMSAFANCSSLTGSLTIPNSITSIGESAFYSCSGLTGNLIIPDSVTSIEYAAFGSCKGFNGSLILGDNIEYIGGYVFQNCNGFTGSLTIPDRVTTIGDRAFYGCTGFTGSLTIPDRVTTIGNEAFRGCSGLTGNLNIGNSVETIGKYAFFTGGSFTGNLIIPDSVITIGERAFYDCSGFTGNLIIPNSVTSIGKYAFYDCSGFTGNLTIGDGVINIMDYAFYGCSGFTGNLIIGDSVETIGSYAFSSKFTGSLTIPDRVTTIGDRAFYMCSEFTGLLKIGNRVESIGSRAFAYCSGFTSAYIPSSVITISASSHSNSPFYQCSSTLVLNCGASSQPSGWGDYWNYYNSGKILTTNWGVSSASALSNISIETDSVQSQISISRDYQDIIVSKQELDALVQDKRGIVVFEGPLVG